MKNLLLACTALAACTAAASAADLPLKAGPMASLPQATGYIEAYGGWASTRQHGSSFGDPGCLTDCEGFSASSSIFSSSTKGSVLGGAALANFWATPTVSMQVDAPAEGTSYNSSSSTTSSLDYLIGGHVNLRDPNRSLIDHPTCTSLRPDYDRRVGAFDNTVPAFIRYPRDAPACSPAPGFPFEHYVVVLAQQPGKRGEMPFCPATCPL